MAPACPGSLRERGHTVVEVNRPNRQLRYQQGKSDAVDAESAARAVLAGQAAGQPKSGTGAVEMIRHLKIARDTAARPGWPAPLVNQGDWDFEGSFEVRGKVADALELAARIARPHLGARRDICARRRRRSLAQRAVSAPGRRDEARRTARKKEKRPLRAVRARDARLVRKSGPSGEQSWSRADGKRLVSTRAQERYALIPIVSTPLYAPDAPPVTIGVCVAICLGVLSAKTSSRSTLTEVKFAALAP